MADFDFALPALPERVWQTLTDPARLATWFMDNDFQPVVGHRFTLHPQGLGGFEGPVYGEVLRVEPFRQIVMSWQYAGTRAMITWSVEAARGGTRLRVEHAGQLGSPAIQPALTETYQRLYGQRLRAVLGGVLLSQVEPAAAATAREHRSERQRATSGPSAERRPEDAAARPPIPSAGIDTDAEAQTDEADTAPVRRRATRRQSLVWFAGCAALVILLGTAGWRLAIAPNEHGDSSADPPGQPGVGVLGAAASGRPPVPTNSGPVRPAGSTTPSGDAGASEPAAGAEVPGTTQPTVDGQAPTTPPAGVVRVSFKQTPQLLGLVVQVTLTNPGPGATTWSNVGVRVPGLNLDAKSSTPSVTYSWKAPLACFTPTAEFAKIPAASTATFSFTVTSVGASVESALVDQAGCA